MSVKELLERLTTAVMSDAGLRRRRRLQPLGGAGDKLFPPTYPADEKDGPARHVFEYRRLDQRNVRCVLIDSVQSQANRMEEALQAARSFGSLTFPTIAVDFSGTPVADIGIVSALEAPHRVFDAVIRDSELDGKRFKDTPEGERLVRSKPGAAAAVFELAPATLIFGAWNSTGEGGGLGAKFPRAVVSEIIGVNVAEERVPGAKGESLETIETRPSGQRVGSRVDPLGIRASVKVYKAADGNWSLTPPASPDVDAAVSDAAPKARGRGKPAAAGSSGPKMKEVKPSEINHSNIRPSVAQLGVTVDYALHSVTISFPALRRLRFAAPGAGAAAADLAAQTALAALAIAAVTAQDRNGYSLRSRCDLVPESPDMEFQIIHADGTTAPFAVSFEQACDLLSAAAAAAAAAGVRWSDRDLVLRPQAKLVDLVQASRDKALKDESDDEIPAT